jgi:hypothetical protein
LAAPSRAAADCGPLPVPGGGLQDVGTEWQQDGPTFPWQLTTNLELFRRLPTTHLGDELHHSGWNSCSSCHGDPSAQRRFLVLPSLVSSRIYIVDTAANPLAPVLHKVVEPEEISNKTGLAFPHSAHCLANGDVMVSCMGDKQGHAEGAGFLLLDSHFNVKGRFAITIITTLFYCFCFFFPVLLETTQIP